MHISEAYAVSFHKCSVTPVYSFRGVSWVPDEPPRSSIACT